MDIKDLVRRLTAASTKNSLRKIGAWCDISHEHLRKIMSNGERANISLATFNKIDAGLKTNDF